jgi:hypothetical protein
MYAISFQSVNGKACGSMAEEQTHKNAKAKISRHANAQGRQKTTA